MAKVSMGEWEKRVERLAVMFANDYGPLHKANSGDQEARETMAERLKDMAIKCDLAIEPLQD